MCPVRAAALRETEEETGILAFQYAADLTVVAGEELKIRELEVA